MKEWEYRSMPSQTGSLSNQIEGKYSSTERRLTVPEHSILLRDRASLPLKPQTETELSRKPSMLCQVRWKQRQKRHSSRRRFRECSGLLIKVVFDSLLKGPFAN